MEGINTLRDILQEKDWMEKLDLSECLPDGIHHKDRKYLELHWKGQSYQFKSLPYWLATDPCTFTKVLQQVISHLHSIGIRFIVYLDDILTVGRDLERSYAHCTTGT